MKKSLFFSVLLLIVATTFSSSCSKYDEGSKFTLLSKKSRMVNDWHLISQTENGFALNLSGVSWHLTLSKDGTAKTTFSYTIAGQNLTNEINGEWLFSNDKSKLILVDSSNNNSEEYTIIKLTNSELKVQQIDSSNGDITIQTWETM